MILILGAPRIKTGPDLSGMSASKLKQMYFAKYENLWRIGEQIDDEEDDEKIRKLKIKFKIARGQLGKIQNALSKHGVRISRQEAHKKMTDPGTAKARPSPAKLKPKPKPSDPSKRMKPAEAAREYMKKKKPTAPSSKPAAKPKSPSKRMKPAEAAREYMKKKK